MTTFAIWFVIGMTLILFPTMLIFVSNSSSVARFEKKYPNLAWLRSGIMLLHILFPTILNTMTNSISGARFEKEHPNLAWICPAYVYFSIIWMAFSIIFTARSFQMADTTTFFVFVIFIPLIGLGIVRGLIEIIFDVSLRLGIRIPEDRPAITIRFTRRRYWSVY